MLHIEPLQRPGLELLPPGPFGAFRAMDASRGETTEVNNRKRCLEEPVVPGLFRRPSHSNAVPGVTPILTVPPLVMHFNGLHSTGLPSPATPQLAPHADVRRAAADEDDSDVSAEEVVMEQSRAPQQTLQTNIAQLCHGIHLQQQQQLQHPVSNIHIVQGISGGQLRAQPISTIPSLDDHGSGVKALNKLARPEVIGPCPRCDSNETKFAYYNNNNPLQPRFFCKSCQRYWTSGGILRNLPPGSGRRKKIKTTAPGSTDQVASTFPSPSTLHAHNSPVACVPAKKQNSSFSAITRRIVADSSSPGLAPIIPSMTTPLVFAPSHLLRAGPSPFHPHAPPTLHHPTASLGAVPLHASMWAGSSGTAFSKFTPNAATITASLSPSTSPTRLPISSGGTGLVASRTASGSQVSGSSVGDLPVTAALRVTDAPAGQKDAAVEHKAVWGPGTTLPGLWSGSPIGSANSTDPSSCSSGASEQVDHLGARYGGAALGLAAVQAAAAAAAFTKGARGNGSSSSCSSQARAQSLQHLTGRDQHHNGSSNQEQQQEGQQAQRRDDAMDAAAAAALLSCMSTSQQQHMLAQLQQHSAEQQYCTQLVQALQHQQQEQQQQEHLQQWLHSHLHQQAQQQHQMMQAGPMMPGMNPLLAQSFNSNGFWPTDYSWEKYAYQAQAQARPAYADPTAGSAYQNCLTGAAGPPATAVQATASETQQLGSLAALEVVTRGSNETTSTSQPWSVEAGVPNAPTQTGTGHPDSQPSWLTAKETTPQHWAAAAVRPLGTGMDPAATAQALAAMSQWGSCWTGVPGAGGGLPAGNVMQYAEQQGQRLWDSLRQQQ